MKELIKTKRLILRKPQLKDAQSLFENYTNDAKVTKYLVWKPHKNVFETEAFLSNLLNTLEMQQNKTYVIENNSSAIGMIDCRFDSHKAELGYVLSAKYWNRGYMSEAVSSIIKELFSLPRIERVWATCHVDNVASYVLLNKVGMTYEGILRKWRHFPNLVPKYGDVHSFSIIRK